MGTSILKKLARSSETSFPEGETKRRDARRSQSYMGEANDPLSDEVCCCTGCATARSYSALIYVVW